MTILTWKKTEPGCVDGGYAFDAHHPDDLNKNHFYQLLVDDKTLDLPESEHRFWATWIDLDGDWDEYLGENLPLEKAKLVAEQNAVKRRHGQ